MKKVILFAALGLFSISSVQAQFGKISTSKLTKAASSAVTAMTVSDADVIAMSREYVDWMDANNPVCDDSDEGMAVYYERLERLTKDHQNEAGLNLNFKVYYVEEANAFACADGSIRVLAGLMDMVTDDELLGIIGHEIGHVKNGDTKDAIKKAYTVMAAKDAVSSVGGTVAKLTDSQLGDLGEALVNAQFSQKQELEADDYGYNFLKRNGYDAKGMASALRKIQAMQDGAPDKINALFSSHPDSGKRAARLEALEQ